MKHILAQDHTELLGRLAGSRALLAFDFDGTLAPIVADRDRAVMRHRTRSLLATASQLYPCAVFAIDEPERLLGLRVGRTTASAARFYLRDQREIDRLLARVVQLRAASTTG